MGLSIALFVFHFWSNPTEKNGVKGILASIDDGG